jgi:HD-like signal output (HDOD) protein/CheY-like chemotaxis protein
MKKLLFVDDAPEILSAIKRSFFDTEYEVLTAENGTDALAVMEAGDISLVVSDLRMPDMDGYQLLSAIKRSYPKVIRILLSGYADERIVMKALKKNVAKVYLLKPWDNDVLLKLINQLIDTETLLGSRDLLSLINNMEELPTIKSSYRHILSLIDQDAEIPEIIRAIETDQSIASKILHIANSAFYGLRTGSVAHAVKYLGLNAMRSLVMTTPIVDAAGATEPAKQLAGQQLQIAMKANMMINLIYERFLHKKVEEMANIAGLLHNVGKTLLLSVYQQRYLTVLAGALEGGLDITQAERDAFQVSYPEAGGYLLQWWDMPFPLVEAAVYHNNPFDERVVNRELLMAIHIAKKYACDSLGVSDNTVFDPRVFDILELDPVRLEKELLTEKAG